MEINVSLENFGKCTLKEHIELYSDDLNEVNSSEKENVSPQNVQISDKIILKKHSWNMIRFSID